MRIVVLGATGGTGRDVVDRALAGGHEVVAVSRHPERIERRDPGLTTAAADVTDASSLAGILRSGDAVLFCVGVSNPRQARRGTTVYSRGSRATIAAMREAGCRRLIALSSAGVGPRPHAPLIYRYIVKPHFLAPAYADMAQMERIVRESDLDWTVVRPPQLKAAPASGQYRLNADANFERDHPLRRGDLAEFLIREVERPEHVRHLVAISG